MLETLQIWDEKLFFILNGAHNPFFDSIMLFVTNKGSWYLLYAIIIAFLIYKYKKNIWIAAIMISLTIGIADQVSSGFLKPTVERLRPCKNPELVDRIHIPGGCGGLYGFTSSHASNHFGVAVILTLMGYRWSKWVLLFLPWAFMIAYSRVYVGVHYPGDVIVGGMIGTIGAFISFYVGKFIARKTDTPLILT